MISEEAVEAGAKGLARHKWPTAIGVWESFGQGMQDDFRDQARAALEAAAPYMTQPVIHDVDWALTVLQKCGVKTADQFDALVTLQKLTP